ncbi:MAG: acetyl-CoA C-acetyltransferase [Cryomorphaceae bacterium]|jgi:acetyl-CoA C-acetyltransferase
MTPTYIYDAIRTPRGKAKKDGALHHVHPYELLKQLYSALESRNTLNPADIEDVLLGCVSQFGEQAGNIARASLIYAGWPDHVPGLTLNRFCSSSLDATAYAADRISCGRTSAMISGGIESMSRVRMMSDQPQWMTDPEWLQKVRGFPLGIGADLLASQEKFSREELDHYALQSQKRALHAQDNSFFNKSLIAIDTPSGEIVNRDQAIRGGISLEELAGLEPAFTDMGKAGMDDRALEHFSQLSVIQHQHTAGNSPGMVDGASMLLLGNASFADRLNKNARAEIIDYRSYCGPVEEVLTGGSAAASELLKRNKLDPADLDLVEFNESFAGPTLKFIRDFQLDHSKVNVNGGAISLGHPMGATGGMLIGTLIDELERRDKELGMVAICGATGSGSAMLLKRI